MKQQLMIVPAVLLLAYPCEETGFRNQADTGVTDAGPMVDAPGVDVGEVDAGPTLESFSYTPEGCSYTVATPEVIAPGMSGTTFGEDPTPHHIHAGWAGETSTTFNVIWETDAETDVTQILYGTDEGMVSAADGASGDVTLVEGHTFSYPTATLSIVDLDDIVRVHEVHTCGLTPSTTYYYKVGGPGNWSEVYDIATGPTVGSTEPWTFAATGDSRNNRDNAWPIAQKRIFDRAVDMQIFTGDAVFLGTLQTNWDDWFEAEEDGHSITDTIARIPIMMSNGNHDALATNYVAQFALPQNQTDGERAQGEEWYSFDYANAHFVVLNDSVADESVIGGAEAEWMRADLMAVDRDVTPWVFVVHHRPTYTCLSTHSPATGIRGAWQPIYDEFEVDMSFTGHNHVYERTNPIRGLEGGQGQVAPAGPNGIPVIMGAGSGSGQPSGTIYVVTAGVGAPLYGVSDECPETNIAESVQPYVTVEINDRTITYTAYNAINDQVIDELTWTK